MRDRIAVATFMIILAGASAPASTPGHAANQASILAAVKQDIKHRNSSSLDALISGWETKYGAHGALPLLQIALDTHAQDTDRFVALMGAAKLGGKGTLPSVVKLLKDRSWMLRSGSLRILRTLADRETAKSALPLLKDPALVVRSEAVVTIEKLAPEGAPEALVEAIKDGANYRGGKAQWVPQKALAALVSLKAVHLVGKLLPLLEHKYDPALQALAARTISILKNLKPSPQPVHDRNSS